MEKRSAVILAAPLGGALPPVTWPYLWIEITLDLNPNVIYIETKQGKEHALKKATVKDKYGNEIYITEERWAHIIAGHTEMRNNFFI